MINNKGIKKSAAKNLSDQATKYSSIFLTLFLLKIVSIELERAAKKAKKNPIIFFVIILYKYPNTLTIGCKQAVA